jgi:hypothetical protein
MSGSGHERRISPFRNRSALHAEIGKEMGQKIGERPDHGAVFLHRNVSQTPLDFVYRLDSALG